MSSDKIGGNSIDQSRREMFCAQCGQTASFMMEVTEDTAPLTFEAHATDLSPTLPVELRQETETARPVFPPAAIKLENSLNCCVRNAASKLYLEADGGSYADGTNCLQRSFSGADYQVWVLLATAGGYYQFIPRHDPTMRLTVIEGGNKPGGNVGIKRASSKLDSQDWQLTANGRGQYVIRSKCSKNSMALCTDTGGSEGANVYQNTYTDDGAMNDEWVLEPFVYPFVEFDQGFFMYHSAYSGESVRQTLKSYSEQAFAIMYRQFGIKAHETSAEMIQSLSDDCTSMVYNCEHGKVTDCTNTYTSENDVIHHKNWGKQMGWYAARGRRTNGVHMLWAGHEKCYVGVDGAGRPAHIHFNLAEKSYYQHQNDAPFIALNLPITVVFKQMVAFVLANLSAIYGAKAHKHNAACITDPSCDTSKIYDAVMGASPTQPSFWCAECQAVIKENLNRFSRSGFQCYRYVLTERAAT